MSDRKPQPDNKIRLLQLSKTERQKWLHRNTRLTIKQAWHFSVTLENFRGIDVYGLAVNVLKPESDAGQYLIHLYPTIVSSSNLASFLNAVIFSGSPEEIRDEIGYWRTLSNLVKRKSRNTVYRLHEQEAAPTLSDTLTEQNDRILH